MDHHAPHPLAKFEGYYNKFALPSGAHLVLVICKINDSTVNHPNNVSIRYVPQDVSQTYHKDLFPETMDFRRTDASGNAFILDIPGLGFAKWNDDGTAEYDFKHETFSFFAKTTSQTPWSNETNTPEGLLVHLPLPLHWHVQSLASNCTYTLSLPTHSIPSIDTKGDAIVHQEKNWAHSFPSAHIWVQARSASNETGICLAGGKILGLQAFLLGYRSPSLNLDFRPPFAVRFLGLGPFMTYTVDWERRSFELSVQNFTQKIQVQAVAPKGTFFPLSPPFPDGHRENYLGQSFQATIVVVIWERDWVWESWRRVKEERFEGGSLEFGGDYYPPAGSKSLFN